MHHGARQLNITLFLKVVLDKKFASCLAPRYKYLYHIHAPLGKNLQGKPHPQVFASTSIAPKLIVSSSHLFLFFLSFFFLQHPQQLNLGNTFKSMTKRDIYLHFKKLSESLIPNNITSLFFRSISFSSSVVSHIYMSYYFPFLLL